MARVVVGGCVAGVVGWRAPVHVGVVSITLRNLDASWRVGTARTMFLPWRLSLSPGGGFLRSSYTRDVGLVTLRFVRPLGQECGVEAALWSVVRRQYSILYFPSSFSSVRLNLLVVIGFYIPLGKKLRRNPTECTTSRAARSFEVFFAAPRDYRGSTYNIS